jgi:hypothetical protein
MAGAVGLLGIYRALWLRQQSAALLAQATRAFCWYTATLLWLAGFSVGEIVPWMVAFVVATIAGERLELAHVALAAPTAQRWFLAALDGLVAGAAAATVWPRTWVPRCSAWRCWRSPPGSPSSTSPGTPCVVPDCPGYVAAGLLTGYAWLALAGLLRAGVGPAGTGARYDATLHAVFLGFTLSMIFVHALMILPAVLRRPPPYRPVLYLPLALLHASLMVRVVVGDGAAVEPVWRWSGVAKVTSVLLFIGCAAALSAQVRRARVQS